MSSEMKEFEDLSKDAVKDGSDHTNDAQSEIADLRKENKKGAEKIVGIKQTISDGPAKKALTIQQEPQSALPTQKYQNEVKKVASSTQMCLGGGINDMMNPDYFKDFLATVGEPLDEKRPSYTGKKSKESFQSVDSTSGQILLQKGDGSDEANQKRAQDQADFKNSVVKAAAKSSGYEAPKVAANIGNQDLKSQGTQVSQKPSFTSDFADLKGLTDTPVVSTNYDKDVKGESSIITTNMLKDNAAKGSGGISTKPFSRGFLNGVASGNADSNKYVLSKPVQNIPLQKPNQIAGR